MNTKADITNGAYSQLRISGLTVNPRPSDDVTALLRLENMAAELEDGRNICLDYNFEEEPDPNSLTNVERPFWQMLETNLAIRLIPDFNKQVPQALIAQASQSMSVASGISARKLLQEVEYPRRSPRGRGNTLRWLRFSRYQRPSPLPPVACSTNQIFVSNVDDFEESYAAYLDDGESISSFVITVDPGLTLVSSTNNTPIINYRIEANEPVESGPWQMAKIVIVTSTSRELTRFVNFKVDSSDLIAVT